MTVPAIVATPPQQEVVYIPGSTKKVCQLTGDFDRTLGVPTLSQTQTRFGIVATDLGSSFEHKGRLFFLFGDTWGRPGDLDSLAWTTSKDPTKIVLDFYSAPDGKWLPPIVPGITQGAFEIPSGGISVKGRIYVVFTTDWSFEKGLMGRSVLAESTDDGRTFRALYDLSTIRFINVSLWQDRDWLYIFGSGAYRKSNVYLARVKADRLSERSEIRYLSGLSPAGKPTWSPDEKDAAPLFHQEQVGEFSVAYIKPLGRYIMLYNAGAPRGITLRSSVTPWGPWSEGTVVFEPTRDHGYGKFMHISSDARVDKPDTFSDPGRERDWGGEYGPYIMNRYTTGSRENCRLFFTMSTWNPYQVVVMQTDLKLVTPPGK